MKKQYLRLSEKSPVLQYPSGLSDRTFVLKALILFAKNNGMVLIPPVFTLSSIHQPTNKFDIKTNMAPYLDLENVLVDGKPCEISTHPTPSDGCIMELEIMDYTTYDHIMERYGGWEAVTINSSQEIIKLARKFRDKFPKNTITIKWRRGDRLNQDNNINGIDYSQKDYINISSADNIVKTLKRIYAWDDVYMLTNAGPDDPEVKKLRECKDFTFHFGMDVPGLLDLQREDNYKMFKVEREMEIVNCPDCWVVEFDDLAETYRMKDDT